MDALGGREVVAQFLSFAVVVKFLERLIFDLADPFAGDAERVAYRLGLIDLGHYPAR